MSRTIITKSGKPFFTNINSEQLLGKLCMMAGATYYVRETYPYTFTLAYSMTKKQANDAAKKLEKLIPCVKDYFPVVRDHFDKKSTPNDLKEFIENSVIDFKNSEGYKCI